ncbi:MAG: MFS transporter [Bacteroidetes bacterium]|nr:MAG: MFS transporter [Bacteroidota bacterium]
MKNKLQTEFRFFMSMPRLMRLVLMTNMIYAFVLPIIDIFVGAYIMRSADNPAMVAVYQLCVYTGIPFTFLINGYLLNKINVSRLYSFGMLLSGISMLFMMSLSVMTFAGVAFAGLIMGISFGFFWANRDFLALDTTNDQNRNYYFGVETFFYTITFILVPAAVGWFLVSSTRLGWFDGRIAVAYQIIAYAVIVLTILSSIVIHQGKFKNPKQKKFIHWKYDVLWYKFLGLATLKGSVQGYLVTAPAILVMRLVGDEGSLGLIQSVSGILTAILLYVLGRVAKPKHRLYIFSAGIVVFFIGALTNQILFSALGVIVFVLCKVLFMPLHDIAYFPIQMRIIDVLSVKENRSEFAYIFNHEFGLYVGRFLGLVLFIYLAFYVSEVVALRYSLLIIAAIQLISIPLARNIINHTNRTIDKVKKDNPNLDAPKLTI